MKVTNKIASKWCDNREVKASSHVRNYMSVNVILTFDSDNEDGDSQEIFNLKILVSKNDIEPIQFFHKKFFKRVLRKCKTLRRDVGDLVKISTCSDWGIYELVTGSKSLCELGHSCKWFFGNGRLDMDPWEKALEQQLGFGKNVDMSWVNDLETRRALGLRPLIAAE